MIVTEWLLTSNLKSGEPLHQRRQGEEFLTAPKREVIEYLKIRTGADTAYDSSKDVAQKVPQAL
jgi:hypothetical protein